MEYTVKHPYLSKMLREGEVVIQVVRRSPYAMIGRLIIILVFLCAPFFFLVPLFHLATWGVWLFVGLIVFGCGFALRTGLLYVFNALVITTERVLDLDQRGVFQRTVSDASYARIQDVSFSVKGIWQTLFHYGTLTIETAGSSTHIVVPGVHHPEAVHDAIMRLVSRQSPDDISTEDPDEGDILKLAQSLKKNLSPNELRKLINGTRHNDD